MVIALLLISISIGCSSVKREVLESVSLEKNDILKEEHRRLKDLIFFKKEKKAIALLKENIFNSKEDPILLSMVFFGQINFLKKIDKKIRINYQIERDGVNALGISFGVCNNKEMIYFLISKKISLESRDSFKNGIFECAIYNNDLKLLMIGINGRINPNREDFIGIKPIEKINENTDVKIKKKFLKYIKEFK